MDDLLSLVYEMKRIRAVEEEIVARYPGGEMRCPTHLSIGQEAVAVGVSSALKSTDYVVSTHRAHAHYLAKGGDLSAMLAEIYGKATGCSHGRGGSMHLTDESVGFIGSTAIVGNTIPIGVGLALSSQIKNEGRVTCIYLGDGAVEEGVFYESINFAILKKLPVIFICENNLYSVYSPLSKRQPDHRVIAEMVQGFGLPVMSGDGNDIKQVVELATLAIQAIREGQGPRFIEFATYRWREHCGPDYDNDIGYRSPKEFEWWQAHDPVQLAMQQLPAASNLTEMDSHIANEVMAAFEFAETSDFPEQSTALNGVFAL